MKNIKTILSCLVIILLCVSGCAKGTGDKSALESGTSNDTTTENTDETDTPAQTEEVTGISNEKLSLMQKALLNQAEFTATDGLRQIKAENIEGYPVYGGGSGSFCVVDMDGDGTNEVAVTYSLGVVIIFHEEDGAIRTYKHTFRQFNPVYSDGTFTGSGSAQESVFYGTIGFTQKGFEYSAITSKWYENDTENIHYYKGGEPSQITAVEITESEYNEIMAAYSMKEVPEYEFTRNNIERYAK
ncbi:MAG: hypothetical protein ACI4EN_03975 [Butyrivibrio sp.]